jgi:hypothetical protein
MIESVATRIWNRPQFQSEYVRLLRRGIQDYVRVSEARDHIDEGVLIRLLQSATHFAATSDPLKKEAAYRIATSIWGTFQDSYGSQLRELVHLVLGRLGNFPAISFLFRGSLEERGHLLGQPMWLEVSARQMDNAVRVTESKSLTLTDFQRRLWEVLETGRSATVTAPTSAGKSYALQYFLAGQLANHPEFVGLYIVPTRALIHQVSTSLKGLVRSLTEDEVPVLTIPLPPKTNSITRALYVLTQERLQILLETEPKTAFSLVIVDEAQTVAADSRGIILQTVIDQLRENSSKTQFLFSSPTASNPTVFEFLFDLAHVERVDEFEMPVAQNLIFLDTDRVRHDQVTVHARIQTQNERIGTVQVATSLLDMKQSLAYLSWHFGRDDQNLVYVGSPAACEDVAAMIADLAGPAAEMRPEEERVELNELAQFLRDHIHEQYLLANTVASGVAFHYGQMPSIVRKSLEDYFDEGILRFLVSTSTLLHGVNLPAKNLFLLDPTKGDEWPGATATPVSPPEFWNLAGRAGRLGREFEGNVFIIDQGRWRANPVDQDKRQAITAALGEQLTTKRDELLDFIRKDDHGSGTQQALESAFVRVFNEYRRGNLDRLLAKFYGTDTAKAAELREALENASKRVSLPADITEHHITVSVFRQQDMYDYLISSIQKKGPEQYIPVHPRSDWNDAYKSLLRLLKRIHNYFECLPKENRSHLYFAGAALRWMRGDPLPLLISDAYEYKKKHARRRPPSIASVIRQVMSDIEQDLCFRYVKYTRCYLDLLKHALDQTGNGSLESRIPSIPLFLELGASSKTTVSLIGLGLSRTTSGILAEKAVNTEMDTRQAEAWLQRQNLEGMGVPGVCIREVEKVWS